MEYTDFPLPKSEFEEPINMGTQKTDEEYALEELRRERDRLLSETDWIVVKHSELGTPVPPEWASYRQSLRDLPKSLRTIPLHPKYKNLDWSKITLPNKPE